MHVSDSYTCPKCHHSWEEEIDVPDWYTILITRPDAEVTVPPFSHCTAWLDEVDGRWHLVDEMSAVVETYWDPKKKKSPWGMLRTYIGKELRQQSERTAAPQRKTSRASDGRY